MRRLATAVALTAALAGVAVPASATARVACQEDQRCWNWRTMGNEQRGVVTLAGARLVVSPARFDRLNRAFRIDWTASRRMRGDGPRYNVQDY